MSEMQRLERDFDRLDDACRDEWTYRGGTARYRKLQAERARVRMLLLALDAVAA